LKNNPELENKDSEDDDDSYMNNVDRFAVRLDAQGLPIDKPISDAVL
jgi:hypothetical protein